MKSRPMKKLCEYEGRPLPQAGDRSNHIVTVFFQGHIQGLEIMRRIQRGRTRGVHMGGGVEGVHTKTVRT